MSTASRGGSLFFKCCMWRRFGEATGKSPQAILEFLHSEWWTALWRGGNKSYVRISPPWKCVRHALPSLKMKIYVSNPWCKIYVYISVQGLSMLEIGIILTSRLYKETSMRNKLFSNVSHGSSSHRLHCRLFAADPNDTWTRSALMYFSAWSGFLNRTIK